MNSKIIIKMEDKKSKSQMKYWVIVYTTGYMETSDSLPNEYLHLIDIGIIKYAICTKENRVLVATKDGCMREVKLDEVKL